MVVVEVSLYYAGGGGGGRPRPLVVASAAAAVGPGQGHEVRVLVVGDMLLISSMRGRKMKNN